MGEEQPQGARGAVPDPLCVNASLHQKRFGDSAPAARTEGARVGRQEPPGRGRTGSPIALGPSLSLSPGAEGKLSPYKSVKLLFCATFGQRFNNNLKRLGQRRGHSFCPSQRRPGLCRAQCYPASGTHACLSHWHSRGSMPS